MLSFGNRRFVKDVAPRALLAATAALSICCVVIVTRMFRGAEQSSRVRCSRLGLPRLTA